MEALGTHFSSKTFTRISLKTLPSSSASTLLGRCDIGFSRSPTFKRLYLHHSISSPIIPRPHVVSDATSEVCLENVAAGIPELKTSKKMHVKFQLQRECMFGEQFLLVGDHPMLGSWNPADAISMNWSDGHTWNVELDVPIESTIQFKFILKQCTGEVFWQPGPDRIFKSWENSACIVISEDWENPEAQKIMEDPNPEFEPIFTGNISNQSEELMPDMMFSGNVASCAEEKLAAADEFFSGGKPYEVVDKQDASLVYQEASLVYQEHILVPGVAPLQPVSAEAAADVSPVNLSKE